MAFDVFEKLSELETEIHILKKELDAKDAYIEELMSKNTDLERQLLEIRTQNNISQSENCTSDNVPTSGISISDMLKETSEAVMRKTGYTYDDRTGLYYDYRSGYYYDPDNQLFYEPKSRTYYKFNSETGEYIYHSKTDDSTLYEKFKELTSQPLYQHMLKKAQKYDDNLSSYPDALERHSRHKRSGSCRSTQRCSRCKRSSSHLKSGERHKRSLSGTGLHRKRRHKQKSHKHQRSSLSPDGGSPYRERKRKKSRRWRSRKSYSGSDTSSDNQNNTAHDEAAGTDAEIPTSTTSFSANPIKYPPCVRLMVLASDHVPAGQLFLITSQESSTGWGCIGRSPALCPSVNFPDDPNVDALHSEILYNDAMGRYSITDRNTGSGTFVNGIAIRKKHKVSLCHGDIVRIGSSRLLVHIHDGQESCGQCDPDEVGAALQAISESETNHWIESIEQNNQIKSEGDISLSERELRDVERRAKLQELKEKYGLKHPPPKASKVSSDQYIDRAAQRRAIEQNLKTAGYPLPPGPGQLKPKVVHQKLITRSSIYEPISSENKGAQLLTKMGWAPGFGLGKNLTGIAEPIVVGQRSNPQAGLGSNNSISVPIEATGGQLSHAQRIAKTRERYEKSVDFNIDNSTCE